MRTAAAVFLILVTGLSRPACPEESAAQRGYNGGFALISARGTAGFSLAARAGIARGIGDTARPAFRDRDPDPDLETALDLSLDPLDPDVPASGLAAAAGICMETISPIIKKDPPASLSLSIFFGRGRGDLFSSLHEHYAWRTIFRAMNLGAGVSRDIPITKAIHVRPYMGVIRSYARLRPSYLYGDESFEYRLTALCVGLPLVFVFN